MAKITAPNSNYCGTSAGVAFNKGVGSTNSPYLIDWFRTHGYKVEEETPDTENSPAKKKNQDKCQPENPEGDADGSEG